MRQKSLVTQIAIAASSVVLVCLLGGGIVLMNFEFDLVNSFREEYIENLYRAIEKRQHAEEEALKKNVTFNAQILSVLSGRQLFDLDREAMEQSLRTYLKYPEILAVSVLDEQNAPFAAAWKDPNIMVGQIVPKNIVLNPEQMAEVDAIYFQSEQEQFRTGRLLVYYTDAALQKTIQQLKDEASTQAQTFSAASRQKLYQAIVQHGIGIVLIIAVLAALLMILLRKVVLKPLTTLAYVSDQLTAFDLTVSINTNRRDEIGKLFQVLNRMISSFKEVLGQVQRSGMQVSASATELSAHAQQQEAIMTTQVGSTNHVLTSVQEISSVARELVKTMQEVAAQFQVTADFASSGQTDLAHMEEAMHQMEQASISLSKRLQTINEKADNITTVVTTITKVAEQTNLLSLNAAIEAEKAGEYGRGFTVVAREIRRLADQTAVSTLDIEQMVKAMQSAVTAGVMEVDKFIAEVHHSTQDVERISLQLSRIIAQVQELLPHFEQVNVAIEHQSDNAQSIHHATEQLSAEMRESKESLHETYAAIGQLREAASTLYQEISRFKIS